MANVLTQNNILDLLESISVRHPSINSFFVGKDWNFTQDTQQLLPALQVYFEEPIMPEGTGINGQGTYPVIIHPLRINIVTWVKNDKTNQRYVLSDAAQVIQNIVNEISTNPFYIRSNAQLTGDINFTELEEFTQSDLGGYGCVLAFRLLNHNTPCGLPQEEIDGYDFPGIVDGSYNYSRIYLTCGTITGCTTFQDYVANAIAQSSSSASLNPTYVGYGNTSSGLTGNSNFTYTTNETLTVQSTTLPAIYGYQASSSPYAVGKLFKALNAGGQMYPVLQLNRGDGTTITPSAGVGASLSFGLPDGLSVFTSSEDNVVIGGIYDIQATTAASSRNTAFVVQTQSGGTLANKLKVSYSGSTSYVPFKVENNLATQQVIFSLGQTLTYTDKYVNNASAGLLDVAGLQISNYLQQNHRIYSNLGYLEITSSNQLTFYQTPKTIFDGTVYIGQYGAPASSFYFEVSGTSRLQELTASTTVIKSNATNPFAVQTTNGLDLMYYNNTSAAYKTLYINNPDYGSYLSLGFIGAHSYLQPVAGTNFTIYAASSASRTDFNSDGSIVSIGNWRIGPSLSAVSFSAETIQSNSLTGSTTQMVVASAGGVLSTQTIPSGSGSLNPTQVGYGNSSSGLTGSTGVTYNSAAETQNTTSGFRINSLTGGTKFEVYQPNRTAGFNSAFSITTSESGTNGGTTASTVSRVNASRINVLTDGNGVFLATGIDAAVGIGTTSADLVVNAATNILRPAGASLQLGTANRTIGNIFIGNSTSMTQGAGSTGVYTLQLGGTRDDGAANKIAYLIKGASAYTTTHYLSVTDNQNNTMFTIGPDGKTGIGLGGASTSTVTPTAFLDVRAVSGNTASIRIRSGATEPTTTNVGDIWNYSNHLRLNFSGLSMNRLLMFTGDTGIMTVKSSTNGYGTIWLSDQAAALYASNTATFVDSQTNTYIRAGGTTVLNMQPTYLQISKPTSFGSPVQTTARIEIESGTTSQSQLRLLSGATPSSPISGDIWNDGSNITIGSAVGLRASVVTATTVSAQTISTKSTGRVILTGGTATVNTTLIGSSSNVFLTYNSNSYANVGILVEDTSLRVNGTSFTIVSSNPLDTSTVSWLIINSI